MKKIAASTIVVLMWLITATSCSSPGKDITPSATPDETELLVSSPSSSPVPGITTDAPTSTGTDVPATSVPAPEPTPTEPGITEIVSALGNLPIDSFLDQAYRQLMGRDPDLLIASGFAEVYGLSPGERFTDLSVEYTHDTQQMESAILELLLTYDPSTLTPAQQISWNALKWYLEIRERGHDYTDYKFLVNPVWGLQNWPVDFLFELPVEDRQDAELYIARIANLEEWMSQVIDKLERNQQAGALPPRYVIEAAISQLDSMLNLQGENLPAAERSEVYLDFRQKVQQLDDLDQEGKETLIESARSEIEETFFPAYLSLRDQLRALSLAAVEDPNQWQLPGGADYYTYLLEFYTGTKLEADQIHSLALGEVSRIQAELEQAAIEAGYPAGLSIQEINQRLDEDTQVTTGSNLRERYEGILGAADQAANDYFDLRADAQVEIQVDQDAPLAYYRAPEPGSTGPGTMVINSDIHPHYTNYNEHVLVHHESIPGHHTQLALAQELDLPNFQRYYMVNPYMQEYILQSFPEGWALYAESLAWEMGLYDDDPFANLGRLRLQLLRVARSVVDTGIHSEGWTLDEAAEYLEKVTGMPQNREMLMRYLVNPGYPNGYTIGSLTFRQLRQRARQELGDLFDIKEYHNTVLGSGVLPTVVLEGVVEDWISGTLQQ